MTGQSGKAGWTELDVAVRDWGRHQNSTVRHDDTFIHYAHAVHKVVGNRNGVQGSRTDEQVSGPVIPEQHFASGKFPVGNRLAS